MTGYTSTSRDEEIAKRFALDSVPEDHYPVVFHIEFKSERGLFDMSADYSAYPDEKEVLLQDGLEYRVVSITEHSND